MGAAKGIETLLPAVRALIADSLVKEFGHSRKEAAYILNLTTAAVSQYLKGQRAEAMANKIRKSRDLMLVVSSSAKKCSEEYSKSGGVFGVTALLDTSYQILSLMTGEPHRKKHRETSHVLKEHSQKQYWLSLLRKRLQSEQVAAQRSMGLALWAKNELAKIIFRQIASDSLRHADIVAAIMAYIESDGVGATVRAPTPSELEEILKEEEQADEDSIVPLLESEDPAIRLLVQSVEADEQKHQRILQGFLRLAKNRSNVRRN
jgi:predicted transcriptional regulator